jgi:hypothetical protein
MRTKVSFMEYNRHKGKKSNYILEKITYKKSHKNGKQLERIVLIHFVLGTSAVKLEWESDAEGNRSEDRADEVLMW